MREELLSDLVKDYIKKNRDHTFTTWLSSLEELTRTLEDTLGYDDKEAILREALFLLYNQIGFNLTVAGPHQLGLLDEDYIKEMEEVINKSDETYTKAMERLPSEVNLFDGFRRVHNLNMELTKNLNLKDLLS